MQCRQRMRPRTDTRQGAVTLHETALPKSSERLFLSPSTTHTAISNRILSSYFKRRKGHYPTKRFDALSVKQVSGNNTNYKLNELT